MLLDPKIKVPQTGENKSFVVMINTSRVLEYDYQRQIPGSEQLLTPFSQRLSNLVGLSDALSDYLPEERQFIDAFDLFEYIQGLIGFDQYGWAPAGCFVWRGRRRGDAQYIDAAIGLSEDISKYDKNHPLLLEGAFGGSIERLSEVKSQYESSFRSWIR